MREDALKHMFKDVLLRNEPAATAFKKAGPVIAAYSALDHIWTTDLPEVFLNISTISEIIRFTALRVNYVRNLGKRRYFLVNAGKIGKV